MTADLSAQIRSHRPGGAKAYYLYNFDQRYPSTGGFGLDPLTLPYGLPAGEYRIGFLSEPHGGQAIAPNNPANPSPTVRLAAETGVALAPGKAPPEKPAKAQLDPIELDPDHLRHRVEYEQIRMADQTVKNKQLLPRAGMRTREIGEAFLLNRAWRQETEQLVRMVGTTQRQSLEQTQQTLKHAKETATLLHEAAKQTPPPPPDHVTPFMGLVGQLITAFAPNGRQSEGTEGVLEALVGEKRAPGGGDATSLKGMRAELARLRKALARKEGAAKKASHQNKKDDKSREVSSKQPKKSRAKEAPKKRTKPKSRPGQSTADTQKEANAEKTREQLPAKGGES